jgi:AcrB/AcrD/AcrF family protein
LLRSSGRYGGTTGEDTGKKKKPIDTASQIGDIPLYVAILLPATCMWIVKLDLNRPYTFIVLALLIFVLSPLIILRTPADIFPNIDIPVISVAWTYTGLNPEDIEARLTTPYEKTLTTLGSARAQTLRAFT